MNTQLTNIDAWAAMLLPLAIGCMVALYLRRLVRTIFASGLLSVLGVIAADRLGQGAVAQSLLSAGVRMAMLNGPTLTQTWLGYATPSMALGFVLGRIIANLVTRLRSTRRVE